VPRTSASRCAGTSCVVLIGAELPSAFPDGGVAGRSHASLKAVDIVDLIVLVTLCEAMLGEDRFPIAALIRQEPVPPLPNAICCFHSSGDFRLKGTSELELEELLY